MGELPAKDAAAFEAMLRSGVLSPGKPGGMSAYLDGEGDNVFVYSVGMHAALQAERQRSAKAAAKGSKKV